MYAPHLSGDYNNDSKVLIYSMLLTSIIALILAGSLPAQYQLKPAGAPPSELDPAVASTLRPEGFRIVSATGAAICEIWLRSALPAAPDLKEEGVTLSTVPHGALLGAIRFRTAGSDRRGLPIKPGVYTLRFSFYPADGNHQGAAPQRDFLILANAADDRDPNAKPDFNALMEMSRKASGAPHPTNLSIWKSEANPKTELEQAGNDWILKTTIGGTPVAIILVGKFEG
jgi:hypothetical protein